MLRASEWSAVLKVVRPPHGTRHEAAAREPRHWAYWKREPLAYGSGLLAGLSDLPGGGLAPPRCLLVDGLAATADSGRNNGTDNTRVTGDSPGTKEDSDGAVWLWLEDVADRYAGWWPRERTLLASRHLGAFGRAFLARLPEVPWLGHGYLRQRVERAMDRLPLFEDEATWRHERLRDHFDPAMGEPLRAVWARRYDLLDVLDALPRTLCHGDSHRDNLIAAGVKGERERTVAVDWGTAGAGPVGADLAELALSRTIGGELLAVGGADFCERLFESYTKGLCDDGRMEGGGSAPVNAARVGFAATVALAGTSRLHWNLERAVGAGANADQEIWSDTDEVLRRWGALTRMFLDLAESVLG